MNDKKIEIVIGASAVLLSLVIFFTDYVNNLREDDKTEMLANIKLEIVELLSESDYTKSQLIAEVKPSFCTSIDNNKISQAMYELFKDKIILYIYDNKHYQLASFHPRNEANTQSHLKMVILNYLSNSERSFNAILKEVNATMKTKMSEKFINRALGDLYIKEKITIDSEKNYKILDKNCSK